MPPASAITNALTKLMALAPRKSRSWRRAETSRSGRPLLFTSPAAVAKPRKSEDGMLERHDGGKAARRGAYAAVGAQRGINFGHWNCHPTLAMNLRTQEDVAVGFLDVAVKVSNGHPVHGQGGR